MIVADNNSEGSAGAAAVAGGVAIAYDHVDAGAGNVPRVFTRIVGSGLRRRAAHP